MLILRSLILACISFEICVATVIQIEFHGTIDVSSFASVAVGDPFIGRVAYNVPDTPLPVPPPLCGPGGCLFSYAIPLPVHLSVAGSQFSFIGGGGEHVLVLDSPTFDEASWTGGRAGANGSIVPELEVFNLMSITFAGTGSVLSAAELPAVFPDISEWDNIGLTNVVFVTYDNSSRAVRAFRGSITAVKTVPEPSNWFLFAAAMILLGLGNSTIRRGVRRVR